METKSFFNERKAKEILELEPRRIYRARGLTERIAGLGTADAVEIRTPITPGRFFRRAESGSEASRRCYHHGDLVALSQPRTRWEAYECSEIPLAIRARDMSQLKFMREEETNFIGYSFRPVQGNDRRKRVVPFVWLPEALRLFAYSETMTSPITVQSYGNARKVKLEGTNVICNVPSREKTKGRYIIRLKNVPIDGSSERRAVAWSLKSEYANSCPEHSLWNIGYTGESNAEDSDVFTFYPHDIAAYVAIIKHFNAQHNLTPLEMSPLALAARKLVDFYMKLCNNVVIYDPSLDSRRKLRKLHIDEKSIMIGRAVGRFGHDETLYWDPARDGMFKDYNWRL